MTRSASRRAGALSVLLAPLLAAGVGLPASVALAPAARAADVVPVDWVDPFIGTGPSDAPDAVGGGRGGSTYPGATVPFGMVQFSPRTDVNEPSGYGYDSTKIPGFGMVHMSGAGCSNGEHIPLLPTVGSGDQNWGVYQHKNEQASPGYYRVGFDNGITSELTATTRAAYGRFTYPATSDANILLDAGHTAVSGTTPTAVVSGQTVSGSVRTGRFCGTGAQHTIHYTATFDRPFTTTNLSAGRVLLRFDLPSDRVVTARVGISYVSGANAADNLATEVGSRSFATVRQDARDAWAARLGTVVVGGGSDADRTKFYTALYHSMLGPTTFSDANGQYLGMDDTVRQATDFTIYSTFSGWDVYRSQVQLLSVLAPDVARNLAITLVANGQQCGVLPKWTDANNETSVMVGDPGTIAVASLNAFGVTNFDRASALALMRRSADVAGAQCDGSTVRGALEPYLSDGYIPAGRYTGSWFDNGYGETASTMEYAVADFALSRFASSLGDGSAGTYAARGDNWRNVFDPSVKYVRGRNADGSFLDGWSPTTGRTFVEGNSAQYTFMVPQNLRGLFDSLGGDDAAVKRLDDMFTELNAGLSKPYFYMGNEPQHLEPWAYNTAGAAYRTQDVVDRIRREAFRTGPGGLPGNDDLGQTSSVFVWAALGMISSIPGTDVLALNSPLFPEATVRLPSGKNLSITASGTASGPYVQSLKVDGASTTRSFLRFADIAGGASLDFALGAAPNKEFGAAAGDRPPSFGSSGSGGDGGGGGGTNLARSASASSGGTTCAAGEEPAKAVDGGTGTKWCARGGGENYLELDLGALKHVSKFVVKHASAGGEAVALNTKAFRIDTGDGSAPWATQASETSNTAGTTTHEVDVTARFVRLVITAPSTQDDYPAARIVEFEVYG